jgi:peptide/nickel transport system permease protein
MTVVHLVAMPAAFGLWAVAPWWPLGERATQHASVMATRPVDATLDLRAPLAGRRAAGAWTSIMRLVRKKPLGAIGGFVMLMIVLTALLAEGIATHDPIATDAGHTLARPSAEHWLGADHLGRDIYSRIVHGARVSLIVGLASTLLGSGLGGIIGLLSGYAGGRIDLLSQRVLDILQGLPLLVLALVMSAALGPSIANVIVAISIPIIPRAARVVRSSVLSIREMQYVEAARGLGLGHGRIAFRHILPNTVGPFIVLCTAQLGGAILVEAALSFLGLGVPEPYPSWGRMLSVSAAEYAQKAPHLVLFPGIAISLAVFGSNLLGDALRDTLDPRLRGA